MRAPRHKTVFTEQLYEMVHDIEIESTTDQANFDERQGAMCRHRIDMAAQMLPDGMTRRWVFWHGHRVPSPPVFMAAAISGVSREIIETVGAKKQCRYVSSQLA